MFAKKLKEFHINMLLINREQKEIIDSCKNDSKFPFMINNNLQSLFTRFSDVIFIILLLIMAYIYDFQHILFLEPQSVHMWRQSDCLSFALNYCKENRSFFDPSINFIGERGNGKTVSDFPLIYFIVGRIWQVTGQHEYIFRGIVLIIFFTGLFFLYRLLTKLFEDWFWAILVSLMLFTSPVLSYYSNNFLMEIPSLSIVLIGWYFFLNYYHSGQIKWLWITMLLFALGGLLKVSSLLSYFALLSLFVFEWARFISISKERPVFPKPLNALFPFLFVIIIVSAWLSFVIHYNTINNRDFFLIGILPIWEMSLSEIQIKIHDISTFWIYLNFPGYFQLLIVILWTVMIMLPKRNNRFFYFLNLVLAIGVISYLLLFFQVIVGHDYYWINLYILLLVTMVSFLYFLKTNFLLAFKLGKVVFVVLLIFNVIYTKQEINERYHGVYKEYYDLYMKDFSSMKTYNRNLGISRDDLVISIPDGTINTSLYLMDQKGWSAYGTNFENEDFYWKYIDRGAKYFFVSDSTLLGKEYLKPFIKNQIGQFRSVRIFDLRDLDF